MHFLYLAVLSELKDRLDEVFWMPVWDKQDYDNGEMALKALHAEIDLRNVWAE